MTDVQLLFAYAGGVVLITAVVVVFYFLVTDGWCNDEIDRHHD